jgi:hypothetical protein
VFVIITGPGFPETKLPAIFSSSYTISTSTTLLQQANNQVRGFQES